MQLNKLKYKFVALAKIIKYSKPKIKIFNLKTLRLLTKVWPFTMVGCPRLINAYQLARRIDRDRVPGAIVECGVWKGGCAAMMAVGSKDRPIWLFDSFEGLPEPTPSDGPLALDFANNINRGELKSIRRCEGTVDHVNKLFFSILKVKKDRVHTVKGWFQDTLYPEKEKIGPIALLRLDGDWYESTKICLNELYDQVVCGGYVIIDDYFYWEGCKKAVDEFLETRNINSSLVQIDESGVYFIKK